MDDVNFEGHLAKIADAARRWTPRLVSIMPLEAEGKTIVYVRMDVCSSAIFLQLIRQMEAFCLSEGIEPDYRFSYDIPAPGRAPPNSPQDLPASWPPEPT